jgi:hypothetical protein
MSSNPALRIGVVLSGTVIAEHVLRDRHPFSIGQSTRTTVSIPISDLPRHLDLIALVDGGVRVRLPAGAQARISVGGELWTRPELDRRGTMSGGETTVVVPLTARGRVELGGEVRILFQGVTLPLAAPAPRLPRALQTTLADRIDSRLAAVIAASVLLNVGVMTVAAINDPPGTPSIARRATEQYQDETIAVINADDPLLDLPKPDPAKPEPTPEPGVQVPGKPEPVAPSHTGPRPTKPVDPGAISDPGADATRLADLLFAPDGDTGKLSGDLTAHKPGTDLGKQLQEIKDGNANTSIGDGTQLATRDHDGPRPGTITDPLVPGTPPSTIHGPDKDPEKVPPGRIKPIAPKPEPGGPDVESIIRKISTTYVGGLQRCYKKSLATEPTLSGKIIMSFTVTDRGKMTGVSATGVADALSQCIEGTMKSWTFTPVVDNDGDPTDVDLRLPLQLTPT